MAIFSHLLPKLDRLTVLFITWYIRDKTSIFFDVFYIKNIIYIYLSVMCQPSESLGFKKGIGNAQDNFHEW